MFPELNRYDRFAYDTETTGLDWHRNHRPFGFSISLPDGRDFYWDIRDQPEAWEWFGDSIRNYNGRVICHNASFDYHMSRRLYVRIPLHLLDDTGIRACLIDEHHMSYQLDDLGLRCLGEGKIDIVPELQAIFGGRGTKNVQMRNLPDAPVPVVARYAKRDTRITLDLWDWQEEQINKACGQQRDDGLWLVPPLRRIVEFERKLMPLVIGNEELGVRVDVNAAERAAYDLTGQIEPIQAKLESLHGSAIDVNSNKQMQLLFKPQYNTRFKRFEVNNEPVPTTPGGNPSLNAEALLSLSKAGDKRAVHVINIRKLLKLRDTFINGHVLSSEVSGRVHPRVHQTKGEDGGTGTGRFSYSSPALQQIPSRDKEVSSIIRPVFLPDEGCSWVESDKASFEVRVFAHLINNRRVIEKFADNPNLDFHQFVADLTNLPRNKPPEGGSNAKQLNLSMIFNSGNGSIAAEMGLPWEWDSFLPRGKPDIEENYITYRKAGPEAMKAINAYHSELPGVKDFAEGAKDKALERGFVFTKYGRRLRFPRGFKAYKDSGLIIQATSADWNKENWMLIDEALKDSGGRMLLNTHDSYSLSLPKGSEKELAINVKERIEQHPRSRVPLILEVNEPGDNWFESYSSKVWLR